MKGTQAGAPWLAVIGLEVHCQLKTRTKLFCGCRSAFGAPPNSLSCPVCTGQPGALPVLNRDALELAVRAALALGAAVAARSRFDRKHYFYCDLPKGYQISQLDQPFSSGGGVALRSGKLVRHSRIHLEEDAGKAIHDRGETTLVDLNRAGVPLIEVVTEADLATGEEAHEYLSALKEILQFAGASDCDMEKGSLRCDVNVSVHRADRPWGTKVELKNLNSFRNVQAAIDWETARQIAALEGGAALVQETRLFDAGTGTTRSMRTKEDAHDYRYLPDPDLPPVSVSSSFIERQRRGLPELPAARRARYQSQLGLSAYDAGVLTRDRAMSDFFEITARLSGSPKSAANWITNEVARHLADPALEAGGIDELPFKPFDLAQLIGLVEEGRVHKHGARAILRAMFETGKAPAALMHELGLAQVSDQERLEAWCRAALQGRESIAADVRAGKDKAVGALLGAVMKASGGSANPEAAREVLLRLIRGGE